MLINSLIIFIIESIDQIILDSKIDQYEFEKFWNNWVLD